MSDPSYLSVFTLPSGTTYYIKDAEARQLIEDLTGSVSGAVHYVGATTTVLSDGSSTKPITVEGESYNQSAGDVVAYGDMEFIWNAVSNVWREFGSTGSLKALAFKDTATGNYTPAGTVSQPSFTGTQGNVSVTGTPAGSVTISKGTGTANYTPEGTVSQPSFTGTQGNVSVSGTPSGSVAIETGTGSANYTPSGSVSVTPSVTMSKTTVKPIATVGSLPSLSFSVSGETLNISWDPGSLPTAGSDVSVATDVASATASATFTGDGVDLEATFTGDSLSSTGTFTPSGTVSQPSFTGTGADLEASFSGSAMNSTGTFTPEGIVSQPSFTGTQGSVTVS